jgi:hypothetical protein
VRLEHNSTAAAVAGLWLGMVVPFKGSEGAPPIEAITQGFNAAIASSMKHVPYMPPGGRP